MQAFVYFAVHDSLNRQSRGSASAHYATYLPGPGGVAGRVLFW